MIGLTRALVLQAISRKQMVVYVYLELRTVFQMVSRYTLPDNDAESRTEENAGHSCPQAEEPQRLQGEACKVRYQGTRDPVRAQWNSI